jgi:hypothetical protein
MVSMKKMMDEYICVIIITKIYVVCTASCVTICAYSNIPRFARFALLKIPLSHVQLLVLILESLIELCL